MERHWRRVFGSICLPELKKLRINSWLYHGKQLSLKQEERINKRLDELEPYFDMFLKRYGSYHLWAKETEEVSSLFLEYVKEIEKGKKLRKIMGKIKKGTISDTLDSTTNI